MEINHVLIVEDDKEIREGVQIYLQSQGYKVFQAADGIEGLEVLEKEEIHLAIIDIMMPRMDGIRMTMKLREKYDFPVIMLSAKSEEVDKITGLNIGADDYVIKPFRNRELVSRIRNVLRRTEKIRRLTCGNIAVEPDTGKVYRDGEPIAVTKLEYKILMTLFSNPHKIFTREEILNGIWDMAGNFVNDNTLTVTMKRLREKLGDKEGNVIVTVRGIGYRLNL